MDSTAADPVRQAANDSRGITRSQRRPEWLSTANVSFALGMLGGISYVLLYGFDASFLSRFGTSPEEVGLSQVTLVARATVFGLLTVVFGSLLALVPMLAYAVAAPVGRRLVPRLRRIRLGRGKGIERGAGTASTGAANIERRARIIAGAFASGVVVLFVLVNPASREDLAASVIVGPLILLGFYFFFLLIARRSHFIAILAFLLMVLSLALIAGFSAGAAVAKDVIATRSTDFMFKYATGLEPHIVCIIWAAEGAIPSAPNEGIFLGHANGVSLVSDGRQLFRIYDGQLRGMVTPLAGDGTTACP